MNATENGALAGGLDAQLANGLAGVPITVPGDLATPITIDALYLLTKGSAAAVSVAAPGAANVGRKITFIAGSAFAHVVTFTGATLQDGVTGGGKTTWTSAAFVGSCLTVVAISATAWALVSKNLGAQA